MSVLAVLLTGLVAIASGAAVRPESSHHVMSADVSAFLQKEVQVHNEEPASHPPAQSKRFNTIIGSVSGTVVGAIVGMAGGHFYEMRSIGAVTGGVSGALAGGLIGWLTTPAGGVSTKDHEHDDKPVIKTKKLPEPALEKMRQQAAVAVALSDYEQARAKKKGDSKESDKEKDAEKKAMHVLEDLEKTAKEREESGQKEAMADNEDEFQDIQEVLSEGDTSEMVTAESAAANGAVMTANDLARVAGGGKGKRVRGEDLGPAGDHASYQGDMIPGDDKQLLLFQTLASSFGHGHHFGNQTPGVAAGLAWPKGKIKYCFASDVPASVKHIFKAACNQYHRAIPCLTFEDVGWVSGSSTSAAKEQKCKESPAIFVQSNPAEGCYSYVGLVPQFQSQKLQLQDPGCVSVGTAIHELGHALGMAHEQSRPDRGKFVKIHWDNIKGGQKHNFDVVGNAYTEEHYDLMSVMHYDAFAFSQDPARPTIEYIGEGSHDELGQRVGLSKYDVSQVVAMYKNADSDCTGNALAGLGCVNKPDAHGKEMCDIKKCNSAAASHCCACGGGVTVQCYEGQTCPKTEKLPDLDASQCVTDATHLFPDSGVPCVYTNVCSFNVGFTCSGGCQNTASSKAYEATQCNGAFVTDICQKKFQCKVHKL